MSWTSIGVFAHKNTPPKNPPPPYKVHHCFLCYSKKKKGGIQTYRGY